MFDETTHMQLSGEGRATQAQTSLDAEEVARIARQLQAQAKGARAQRQGRPDWWTRPEYASLRDRVERDEEVAYALDGIGPRRRAVNDALVGAANGFATWLRRHWLATVNCALGLFIGVAFLGPIADALGFVGPGSAILHAYRFACGQTPSHSFYLFGYQVCLCSRCLAIYTSLLIGGLTLALTRARIRIPHIGWRVWLLTILPMALDGGTQLFGWRESNLFLRLLTGTIFGLGVAWFMLPQIEEAARDDGGYAPRTA